MDIITQMKLFMEPKSVAFVGISRRTGEEAFNILENILAYGYRGRIYPVNPNVDEILGVKTYPSVAELPETPDMAVINLPRDLVPGMVRECIEANILAIVIVTQGFTDASDEQGKELQREIDQLVKNNRARIVGPNSFGTANAFIDFSSSFLKLEMERIPFGVICQTGVFFVGFPRLKLVGKGVDLANACDIDFADCLQYFEQDQETKLVALHIEGIKDGRRFFEVASRFAQKKPLLALKTGRGERAAKAAQSHTGSLVGKDEVWETALKQAGVIRVDDEEELQDMVKALSIFPLMKGRKVGIVTYTGGVGIMSVDACQRYNLRLAKLSPSTVKQIGEIAPPWLGLGNPLDIWPVLMLSRTPIVKGVTMSIEALLKDNQFDAVLFIGGAPTSEFTDYLCQILPQLTERYPDKPLVCHIYGAHADEARDKIEEASKTMVLPSPERAVKVLARLAQYSEFRSGF